MPITLLRGGDDALSPLVCVHPISGRGDVYQPLAAALHWAGPVLGIDAPDPSTGDPAYRLTDLAGRYAEDLDCSKPIRLLGWSLGGVIAAELSRAIIARGGRVEFLAILDSRAPQPEMRTRPTDRDSLARMFLQRAALTCEREPGPPPASSSPRDLLAALRAIGVADDIADEADLERRFQMFMGLGRALYQHEQQPLAVYLHLFEAAASHPSHPKPPTLGWDDLVPGIEKHITAGTHYTVLAPRHIAALSRALDSCLASNTPENPTP